MNPNEKPEVAQEVVGEKKGAKDVLLDFVNNFNFDDGQNGRVVRMFKNDLMAIVDRVEELESAGFTVVVEGKQLHCGAVHVTLERPESPGQEIEIYYSPLFDKYGDEPRYLPQDQTYDIKIAIDTALKTSKMFKMK